MRSVGRVQRGTTLRLGVLHLRRDLMPLRLLRQQRGLPPESLGDDVRDRGFDLRSVSFRPVGQLLSWNVPLRHGCTLPHGSALLRGRVRL